MVRNVNSMKIKLTQTPFFIFYGHSFRSLWSLIKNSITSKLRLKVKAEKRKLYR